ncbi:MAG: hypothetical protein PVF45_04690 [Anaerolineae bacterium]
MTASSNAQPDPGERRLQRTDLWNAFKTFAILFSFTVNLVLIIVLLILGGWILFPAKTDLAEPMLNDLQGAVTALDEATIYRTIPIDQQVPVSFTLPLNQTTAVVLSEDVELIRPATFHLPGGGGAINGTVALNLPKGLELPVHLNLDVPVDNSIPVQFPVEVTIPLKETELNQVVVKLDKVLGPLVEYLNGLPDGFCLLGFCIGTPDE